MEVAKFTDRDWTFCLWPRADVYGRCALRRVDFVVNFFFKSRSETLEVVRSRFL